jgi:hypothetical protein
MFVAVNFAVTLLAHLFKPFGVLVNVFVCFFSMCFAGMQGIKLARAQTAYFSENCAMLALELLAVFLHAEFIQEKIYIESI